MWPRADETQELLREIESGSREALDALLARHRDAVRRLVGLRLDPAIAARVDASDIVQEVCLEAAQRVAELREKTDMPFHLWLRRIALDRLVDAHRRHRRTQKRSVDREARPTRVGADASSIELVAQLCSPDLTPSSEAMRRELARRFEEALPRLSDDDREVLFMRHFEQLSNSDVARALSLSEPAAGMRHLRALRRLRDLLAVDGAESRDG